MDFKDKAESLADKMNRLSEKFELAEEMSITGSDIVQYVEDKTEDIELFSSDISPLEIINLQNMVDDFKYVRDTLKETADNGRRVLNSVTLDLLESDGDKRAGLIISFAELNKAVTDNMKLYIQSYKEISNTLLNLDKIKKQEAPKTINNTVNVTTVEPISTVDLIKKLKGN